MLQSNEEISLMNGPEQVLKILAVSSSCTGIEGSLYSQRCVAVALAGRGSSLGSGMANIACRRLMRSSSLTRFPPLLLCVSLVVWMSFDSQPDVLCMERQRLAMAKLAAEHAAVRDNALQLQRQLLKFADLMETQQ